MKKKIIIISIMLLIFLLFPIRVVYKDGGTKTYTSLIYKVIVWNTLDGKSGTEVYFFPNNFKSLGEYYYYDDENKNPRIDADLIKIYDFNSYEFATRENYFELGSIDDKKDVDIISDIISRAKKINGLLSVMSPNYTIEFFNDNTPNEVINFWVNEGAIGMLVYNKNTSTGYEIEKEDGIKLYNIIKDSFAKLDKPCEITKTYNALVVNEKDKDSYFVNLSVFQGSSENIVEVPKRFIEIVAENTYEITFKIDVKLDENNTLNLFENAEVMNVVKTEKIGVEQTQESCKN